MPTTTRNPENTCGGWSGALSIRSSHHHGPSGLSSLGAEIALKLTNEEDTPAYLGNDETRQRLTSSITEVLKFVHQAVFFGIFRPLGTLLRGDFSQDFSQLTHTI